jgi:hypothetical protein
VERKKKKKTRVISKQTGLFVKTVQRVIKLYHDLLYDQLPVRKPRSWRLRKTGKTAANAMLRTMLKVPTGSA